MDDGQLQRFSESLSPPPEYVDLAKKTIQKVFLLLQKNSHHSLARVQVVGGIEKKTSTAIKADVDSVIYYNDPNHSAKTEDQRMKKKEDVVDDFQNILLLNTDLTEEDIYVTRNNSMQFSMDGVPIDLLVGVNLVSNPRNVSSQQSSRILQLIKHSNNPQKASQLNSSELSESSLEFLKSKSKLVHDVARLAKFWSQNILFKTYVFGKSLIMELLAVDAAMEEENSEGHSISKAFKGFLKRVNLMKNQEIIFQDFYKISDIPLSICKQRPLLMDPSNPYNNLLHAVNTKNGQHFMEVFQFCAGVTYDMMSRGIKDINLLFYPQPLLYQLRMKEKWIKPKDKTYQVSVQNIDSCLSFNQISVVPLMPEYILRDKQGSDLKYDLQSMLYTLAGFTYSTTKMNPSMPSQKIQDEIKGHVDKMDGMPARNWVPGSWQHDKKAVTMMVPLNDPDKRVLLLSFDFHVVKM